jgi:stearoyl-CoA desaturase (delta-9 desaturase)
VSGDCSISVRVSDGKLLEEAIRESSALRVVVEYRRRLKALMQPAVQETDRLARLQEWCASAESTGIAALDDFARQLRGYSMRSA